MKNIKVNIDTCLHHLFLCLKKTVCFLLKFTDSCNAVGLGSFHLKITLINLAICKLFLIHFKRLLPRNSSSYISGQKKCHLKFKKGLKCFYVYKPSKFFLCPSCCFQKCKGMYIRLARIIHADS